MSSILLIVEIAIIALIWIVAGIVFKVKHKDGFLKLFIISLVLFSGVFGATFVFEKPSMDLKDIEYIEVFSDKGISKPKTSYHFQDVTDDVKVVGEIDVNKLGEYEVKFEYDTLTGKYVQKQKVKVVDTIGPEITLEGEEDYKQSYATEYQEPGYKAVDKYSGDVTDKVTVTTKHLTENSYDIKYEVTDEAGNKTEKVRKVAIVDNVPPKITLNGYANSKLIIGENYEEKGASAVDEIDGDLSSNITIEGTVDTSKEGSYQINYKVLDNSGNEAVATRTVVVAKTRTSATVAQDGSNGPKGVIYLTFDDGPTSDITPKMLDVLKEKNVPATFFIINYDNTREALVKREVAEGHTVAIHGYSHNYGEIYQSVDAYLNNLSKLQEKIKNSTGYTPTVTRFPGGSSNTISRRYCQGIMSTLTKEVVERGYTYFDWNVDSDDAGKAKTADEVYNNVTRGLKKTRQNVVLMHDFSGNNKTLEALPRIIDYGIQNGYIFSSIDESTPMVTHAPNN